MGATTDKDALVTSQIAYMNIKNSDIEEAKKRYGSATLENIFKVSNFRQVNDFKKKAGRITSTYGHLDMESKLISLNNMTETYQNLDHLMKKKVILTFMRIS